MISYIETTIALIFIFTVLVMAHELGHFLAARAVGIRVEEFAFGFGPKLFTLFKRKDTEYTVHALPIGGFVRLSGMEPGQEDVADGYQHKSVSKRALAIFAGPLASFLLAVIVFLVLGIFWGFPVGKMTNEVGFVEPGTEAFRVGMRSGDHIISINGTPVADGEQMINIILANPDRPVNLLILRNGQQKSLTAVPKWRIEYLGASWLFMNGSTAVIDSMAADYPAAKANIMPGDKLISINHTKIHNGMQMVAAIKAADNKLAHLEVLRDGKTLAFDVNPSFQLITIQGVTWSYNAVRSAPAGSSFKEQDILITINGKEVRNGAQLIDAAKQSTDKPISLTILRDGEEKTVAVKVSKSDLDGVSTQNYYAYGVLGFQPNPALVQTGFTEAISRGMKFSGRMVQELIATLTSKRIKEEVGGPLMITKATHSAVSQGAYQVFQLMGGLSLSLAIINLLPIPVVDGGHLVLLGLEAIRKKRLTAEQMGVYQFIGVVIIGAIFILVFWSDLYKLLTRSFPQ